MVDLLIWPLAAGLVLTSIHAYFGLHVLARGVVFVDLSLAQVAALGLSAAIVAGHSVHSEAGYWYSFAFAVSGALLFALARPYEKSLQQEAIIGIVYAVSASLCVLALDRAPQGTEHIKQLLIGSILTVTPQEVGHIALLYAAIGAVHIIFRKQLLEVSFDPALAAARPRNIFLWDVVFYVSFALVVTSSVRIAGVLLVFSYLIVPAALAGLLVTSLRYRLVLSWILGGTLTAVGLYASWIWDLPTGPAIVTTFGAAIGFAALGLSAGKLTKRKGAIFACTLAALSGALLVAFPDMDHPWIDALEEIAPPVQTAFLQPQERYMRNDVLETIERARTELARLKTLEQDARWGRSQLEPEQSEQLRQYIAGRSEISAGDQLVLRDLRGKARKRQRFALGLPLLIFGAVGGYLLRRRPASNHGSVSNGHPPQNPT